MIKSRWRFTHGNLVTLDYGDGMGDHPTFPISALVEERPFIGADWAAVFNRGNRTRPLAWSRVSVYGSVAEAQSMMIELPPVLVDGTSADLMIEVEGGGSYEIADFSIRSCTPSHRSILKPNEVLFEFEGQGGEQTTIAAFGA